MCVCCLYVCVVCDVEGESGAVPCKEGRKEGMYIIHHTCIPTSQQPIHPNPPPTHNPPHTGRRFFVTPSDSLAIIVAHADVIPFFRDQGGLKGVARSMPTSGAVDLVSNFISILYYIILYYMCVCVCV